MKIFRKSTLALAMTAAILSGCSNVEQGLNNTTRYLTVSSNWLDVKQTELINKLLPEDQEQARIDTAQVDVVLSFIRTWSNADSSHKKKLALKLPVEIQRSRRAFSRLNTLVIENKDRFTENDLNVMRKIRNDAVILSQEWDSVVSDNEKISRLLTLIDTAVLLKKLKT